MNEKLFELWEVSKASGHTDNDIKRLIEAHARFFTIQPVFEELDDLRAYKCFSLHLANRMGFDSLASALDKLSDIVDSKVKIKITVDRNATPSQRCKELGMTLAHVSRVSGTSVQTLINWHKNKPWLFDVVLAGVKALS
jgi:hypothetical protein